ncbi:hypothetical protein D3C84_1137050 [compost metagenome]
MFELVVTSQVISLPISCRAWSMPTAFSKSLLVSRFGVMHSSPRQRTIPLQVYSGVSSDRVSVTLAPQS